jgi:organic radical activating enzyme
MLTAPITEIFRSFQGEGKYLGKEMVFVRFAGCNLRCDYCDTPRALDAQAGTVYTENQLVWAIKRNLGRARLVAFTGGEPTLYAQMITKVRKQLPSRIHFFLETNGTLPDKLKICAGAISVFSIDLKPGHDKAFIECVKIARKQPQADVYAKLVLTKKLNPEHAAKTLKKAGITDVFVQPEYGRVPKCQDVDELVYTLHAHGIHCWLVPQFHKLLKVR